MPLVFRTSDSAIVQDGDRAFQADFAWDDLFTAEDPFALVRSVISQGKTAAPPQAVRAPIGSQEVWAAGVTYYRSRTARMEESKQQGGDSFYDKVYHAERPELFFKSTPHRVSGPGEPVHIRSDSKWNVPEPELTLAVSANGKILGYTIGNDMSSRDIEGENPLYLPQAKVYYRSCALGPAILVSDQPLSVDTSIQIEIRRTGAAVFSGETAIRAIKRTFPELVEFLYRSNQFPVGCFLMTGTGVVPPDHFTLASGDEIRISIAGIGELVNSVA